MIELISIKDLATYKESPVTLTDLRKFNFFYGGNGTGKTTISRVIDSLQETDDCTLKWKGEIELQTLVYNRYFVSRNFEQSPHLNGVFTLGEDSIDTQNAIQSENVKASELDDKIIGLRKNLDGDESIIGKNNEISNLEKEFEIICWTVKQNLDAKFKDAFTGARSSGAKFKTKVLEHHSSNNSELETIEFLEAEANTLFGTPPELEDIIVVPDFTRINTYCELPILNKIVIGKNDVDVAQLIKKFGNSDWVRLGIPFLQNSDSICPFCQQELLVDLNDKLNLFFDEEYETDIASIRNIIDQYAIETTSVLSSLQTIIENVPNELDVGILSTYVELIKNRIKANGIILKDKLHEPSRQITLEPFNEFVENITNLFVDANERINQHNSTVRNYGARKKLLISKVWKYILDVELQEPLTEYLQRKDRLTRAIEGIQNSIDTNLESQLQTKRKIRELESNITSIQPTIESINSILSNFGFQGFTLATAEDNSKYKLVRDNGEDAHETLSEGEKSFVTYLYFYHLLRGSESASNITNDRVVVIDDPVSSLDADILYVVSSLIKGIFDSVSEEQNNIKQIFVLTHNVYFFKEVTFNAKRSGTGDAMNNESFWMVRKINGNSCVERHNSKPVKTSYELLWDEIKSERQNNMAIQNCMRRILEHYFRILGNIDYDEICELFDGSEKLICKSLFAWINDGSHGAHEDEYISIDDGMIEKYIFVFKKIFQVTGHDAHYSMMMGEN